MAATPLSDIHLPPDAITQLAAVDIEDWIHNHTIPIPRSWWTETLKENEFEDTLVGDNIRRADIFALAKPARESPDAALTLLWNALAWGSSAKLRNNKARVGAVAADRDAAGELLQRAADKARTDPLAAYELMYPRNKTAISDLGPAFFTKFLYFAGGGAADHPCAIIDENVALALNRTCGWDSLPTKNWYATAYERYATLLGNWVNDHNLHRRDVIERWLFERGKTLDR